MKLVYVHGRSQQGKSGLQIRTYWTGGLNNGYVAAGYKEFPIPSSTDAPFYGDELIKLLETTETVATRGAGETDVDPIAFAIAERMAVRSGTNTTTAVESEVVERGPSEWGWVQTVLRAVSERAPGFSESVLNQFVDDVMAYLSRATVRDAINGIVKPFIDGGEPTVVVGHSLGTVVAYSVLMELGTTARVPLYVTAGSPLGLRQIQDKLEEYHPITFPKGVDAWLNATDERDLVALYASLDEESFIGGITNLTDVDNRNYPHDIAGYLTDARVADAIGKAIQAGS